MASLDGKGSIILKIVIVLLVVAMIIVIILPGQIWQEEDVVRETSRSNMSTLFEAHKYYFGLKGTYTANDEELILTVQNDSALLKRQIVVNHTTRLRNAMEKFLSDPVIKNLFDLSSIPSDQEYHASFFIAILSKSPKLKSPVCCAGDIMYSCNSLEVGSFGLENTVLVAPRLEIVNNTIIKNTRRLFLIRSAPTIRFL